jgi:hypothetical protein
VFILDRTALFELLSLENMFPRIHVRDATQSCSFLALCENLRQ